MWGSTQRGDEMSLSVFERTEQIIFRRASFVDFDCPSLHTNAIIVDVSDGTCCERMKEKRRNEKQKEENRTT